MEDKEKIKDKYKKTFGVSVLSTLIDSMYTILHIIGSFGLVFTIILCNGNCEKIALNLPLNITISVPIIGVVFFIFMNMFFLSATNDLFYVVSVATEQEPAKLLPKTFQNAVRLLVRCRSTWLILVLSVMAIALWST